jgi:2'-5' RNA ligase
MPRLFTALELPEMARVRLAALRAPFERARWVKPEDYHITLRFLGDLTRKQADEIGQALADLDMNAPSIRVAGTGVFGGKVPTAVYATVKPTAELEALARAHDRAAKSVGLAPDARKFVPHVTLARLDHVPVETIARFLERSGDLAVPPFYPTRAVMMSAREGGGGPYGVVDAFPFAGQYVEDDA